MTPGRVTLIMHQGLGDVILALPALAALDAALPEGSSIRVVVASAQEEALLGLVNWRHRLEVSRYGFDRGAGAMLGAVRLAAALRAERPDVLLGLHLSQGAAAALFARTIGARTTIVPEGAGRMLGIAGALAPHPGEHKAQYFARFAERAGLTAPGPLGFPELDRARLEEAASRFDMPAADRTWVTIAPDTKTARHKRWPMSRIRELITRLLKERPEVSVGLFGAPSERGILEDASAGFDPGRTRLFAHPSIPASLAVLERSAVHVSACTGAVHMPGLVGTPVVGLYGPTNPGFTGPFASKAWIVRAGFDCSPCYRPGFEAGCGMPLCMSELAVEPVLAAIGAALAGAAPPERTTIVTTTATAPARPQAQRLSEALADR